jgi:hypothetical protein
MTCRHVGRVRRSAGTCRISSRTSASALSVMASWPAMMFAPRCATAKRETQSAAWGFLPAGRWGIDGRRNAWGAQTYNSVTCHQSRRMLLSIG